MDYPTETIKKSELKKNLKPVGELQCLEVTLDGMLPYPDNAGGLAMLVVNGAKYGIQLESYEATILRFAMEKCSDFSHILNAHQLVLATHNQYGATLKSATLESMAGEVIYARLFWSNYKHKDFTNICSVADALIYHSMTPQSKLLIVKNVVDALDPFEEKWQAQHQFFDQ